MEFKRFADFDSSLPTLTIGDFRCQKVLSPAVGLLLLLLNNNNPPPALFVVVRRTYAAEEGWENAGPTTYTSDQYRTVNANYR